MFTNGEKPNGKNPTGWFSGHHSRNSTIITASGYKQGIPNTLPTYSSTLTPIPNRTCFVVTVPLSDARLLSTWLTNCVDPSTQLQSPIWKDCWMQSSSVHPHDEDQEDAANIFFLWPSIFLIFIMWMNWKTLQPTTFSSWWS